MIAVARLVNTGLSREFRRYEPSRKERPRPSGVDPFKDHLPGLRAEQPLSAVRLRAYVLVT